MNTYAREIVAEKDRLDWIAVLRMAFIGFFATVMSVELHECFHLFVGRLVGLPSHFLALTSAGVSPEAAANATPTALALMNGVAPILTMLLGVFALYAVPRIRRKAPDTITNFIAWWAIFGVQYIGVQTMMAAAPVQVRGNGADFAAVIGGYFGVPELPRALISVAGLIIYMASGFWLRAAVCENADGSRLRADVGARLRALPRWRLVAGGILGLLAVFVAFQAAILLAGGHSRGIALLVRAIWPWAAAIALLVRWRDPAALHVRNRWIIPGVVASAGLMGIGLLSQFSDFFFLGTILIMPLIASAWACVPDFHPIQMRGENLSSTVLRDRR